MDIKTTINRMRTGIRNFLTSDLWIKKVIPPEVRHRFSGKVMDTFAPKTDIPEPYVPGKHPKGINLYGFFKAENGLALSKMALYQLCGLDLRGDYRVTEDNTARMFQPEVSLDMQQVWDNRTEIKLLELGDRLARTNVRIATSGLLPNVAVSSSYLVSNPNILNGYQNKFGGMFTAGVVVNIPICHVNDIYAVKAARHRRNQVQYELEEAKGMIELQVNKLNYELEVANRKLAQAQSNLENAEENLRLADESFEAGVISSSDLMAAQTAWLSAKSEVVDAEIETRMDYLYLQQALGR
jgi:outer membrane protein TolC